MTAEEWGRAYAARCGTTLDYVRAHGFDVRPCFCEDDPSCEGWQLVQVRVYDQRKALLARRAR